MTTLRPMLLTILFAQISSAQTAFKKPSEAYVFAQQPMVEWEAAMRARTEPATTKAPEGEERRRSEQLCSMFSVESESGEELYWLAKLCERDHEKAQSAVERYLAASEPIHGPDARILLVQLQVRATRSWESSWPTIRTILQQDPMASAETLSKTAIEEEAETNLSRALDWAKECYSIFLARSRTPKSAAEAQPLRYALNTGCDLVHFENLAGNSADAAKFLTDLNSLQKSSTEQIGHWTEDKLFWANMEMKPAPEIPISKVLGRLPSSGLVQSGRVEVLSFFFLACSPCITELPNLDTLQERYGAQKLLVADVTTYKANEASSSSNSDLERSMEAARVEKAPHIAMVITSDETPATYSIRSFPTVVVVDKKGQVRFVGPEIYFGDDDTVGELVRRLIQE